MKFQGYLQKMRCEAGDPIQYYLNLSADLIHVNSLLGKNVELRFQHLITCHCGKEVNRVFRQNFCFDCFQTKPEAGQAIFFPEKSQAHLGIEDRDLEFEMRYQLQPHVVYLANSGGLKVGVTRMNARFQRWIDQGALEAIVLAETENRHQAGVVENALKSHLSDKTNWRKMLSSGEPDIDLLAEKNRISNLLDEEQKVFLSTNNHISKMSYPVTTYTESVKSTTFKKTDAVKGTLAGIRGQYLIFSDGSVFNVRSHEGHHVQISS